MSTLILKSVSDLKKIEPGVDVVVFPPEMDLDDWVVPDLLQMKFSSRLTNPTDFNFKIRPGKVGLYAATKIAYPIVTDFMDDPRFTSAFDLIVKGAKAVMPVNPDKPEHLAFSMAFISGAYLTHLRRNDEQKYRRCINLDPTRLGDVSSLPLPTPIGYRFENSLDGHLKFLEWTNDWRLSSSFDKNAFNRIFRRVRKEFGCPHEGDHSHSPSFEHFAVAVVQPFEHALTRLPQNLIDITIHYMIF